MKKSKIIVPALGLLLLSTAASVSGTVAWFTANRTYNNTISTFGVGEIDGNLSVTSVANIAGTTVSNNTGTSTVEAQLAVDTHASILADASWEYDSGILYTDNGSVTNSSTGVNETSFISLGTADGSVGNEASKWKVSASETNYMYYACAYTMTFKYDFTNSDSAMNLFIDLSSTGTSFSSTKVDNEKANEIKSGLRVGFVGTTTTNETGATTTSPKVLAPFQGTAGNVKCVDSVSGVKAVPTATVLTNSSNGAFNVAKAADEEGSQTSRLDYLGTFSKDTTDNSYYLDRVTVKVVIWLEGTDPDVVSASTYSKNTFSANIKFYCAKA